MKTQKGMAPTPVDRGYMQDPAYMQHAAEYKAALVEYKAASADLGLATKEAWQRHDNARNTVATASAKRNAARLAWLAAQKEAQS